MARVARDLVVAQFDGGGTRRIKDAVAHKRGLKLASGAFPIKGKRWGMEDGEK